MKKFILLLALMLAAQLSWAQPGGSSSQQNFGLYIAGRVVPTRCTAPSVFTAWTGVVYTCQSNVYVAIGIGSGGVINPSALPTLLTGTSGTDVNWLLDVSSVTLNIPDASATARGLVTTGAQGIGGNKTLFGSTLIDNDLYVTGNFSTDHPIEITGEACGTSEANVGLFGFDPVTGLPCFSYDGSATGPIGTTTFLGLTDTPSSYSGQAGKITAVNPGETALEFINAPTGGTTTIIGSGLISGGGVVWTSLLNFTVSVAQYYVAGNTYSSAQTDLTLDAANGANPRIDVFAANDAGAVVIVKGTAATPAAKPSIDPTSQVELGFAYVDTSAVVPSNFSTVDIYLENTEWTTAVSANFAAASTSNPYAGTKDVEATTAVATNYVTFTKPAAATENLASYATIGFRIRSKASWAAAKGLTLTWLNGTTQVGLPVSLKSGTFGFTSSTTGSYQLVVLPLSLFNTGQNLVTTFKATVSGGGASIGFYIDNVLLQAAADGAAVPTTQFADGIVPTGAINSANQTYVLPQVPNPSTGLHCYGNGLRFKLTADYTLSLATVTTVGTFQTGDTGLVCDYRY